MRSTLSTMAFRSLGNVVFSVVATTAVALAGAMTAVVPVTAVVPASAADLPPEPPADHLTVVMTELDPFVLDDDGDPDGFYAEIWGEVAAELRVTYDVVWVGSFSELLPAIAAGQADVAVAPLAPTAAREREYDFTSAVVASGPSLGYHERLLGDTSLLSALASMSVLRVVGLAIVALVVLAHLIWLVERNHDDEEGSDFSPHYLRGLWDGLWWATVTVTTVGYGDKAPRSVRGRLVALFAMLLSLFLVGAFVSQVTDVLGTQRLQEPLASLDDVGDRPVGVVGGSSFASFVADAGLSTVDYPSQQQLFEAVAAGEVDIMVANPFALDALGPHFGVTGAGGVLYEEFETFGVAQDSPWREPINEALAGLQASGEVEAIVDRWRS